MRVQRYTYDGVTRLASCCLLLQFLIFSTESIEFSQGPRRRRSFFDYSIYQRHDNNTYHLACATGNILCAGNRQRRISPPNSKENRPPSTESRKEYASMEHSQTSIEAVGETSDTICHRIPTSSGRDDVQFRYRTTDGIQGHCSATKSKDCKARIGY